MNELDKEIDQFRINLDNINKLTKTLTENNNKIINVINETTDIEIIKKDIKREINKLDVLNTETKKIVSDEIKNNSQKYDLINDSVNKINNEIQNNKKIVESIDKRVTFLNNKIDMLHKKQSISIVLIIILTIICLVGLIIK